MKGFDYSQAAGYFITVSTLKKLCLFGEVADGVMQVNPLRKIVLEYWNNIPIPFPNVTTDEFVIMPNHVHGIIFIHEKDMARVGTTLAAPLPTTVFKARPGITRTVKSWFWGAIVRSFKSSVTRRAGPN